MNKKGPMKYRFSKWRVSRRNDTNNTYEYVGEFDTLQEFATEAGIGVNSAIQYRTSSKKGLRPYFFIEEIKA
jgi:hypothetical protein